MDYLKVVHHVKRILAFWGVEKTPDEMMKIAHDFEYAHKRESSLSLDGWIYDIIRKENG